MDLGQQIGPLPLGAWLVAVGGGVGLALYARKQQTTTPTVVDDTSGQSGVGDGSVNGGWVTTTPPSTGDTSTGDNAPVTTNEAWAVRAINWLIAQGYDATTSDSAIRKYIAGNEPPPSIMEYTLQGLALQHFGSPPQPLPPAENPAPTIPPPPTQAPPPVTTPPPPPAPTPQPSPSNVHWYWVQPWPAKGSTLWGISEMAYGAGNKWPTIYNANKTSTTRPDGSKGPISNPDLIKPGWKLWIPV